MSKTHAVKTILLCLALSAPFHLAWADNHYGPKAIEARVQLGDSDGAKVFEPKELTFERGNYYKLIITNASPEEHYFHSDGFATHVFTRKIRVLDSKGEVAAEVHGAVNGGGTSPRGRRRMVVFSHDQGRKPETVLPHRWTRRGRDGRQHQHHRLPEVKRRRR